MVSDRHACIEYVHGGFFIRDMGSSHGTYLNNERVSKGVLKPGDQLQIGGLVFKVLKTDDIEARHYETLYNLTLFDSVTGAYNKRFLLDSLNRELGRWKRHGRPLSFGIFDIDHFKKVNDDYGHLCGDQVLQELARRVRVLLRGDEVFGRVGGDEFAIVFEANLDGALTAASRIINAIRATPFEFRSHNLALTISMGIATTSGQRDLTTQALVAAADALLYEAKRAGRDRVVGGNAI